MSTTLTKSESWPPKGWSQFKTIVKKSNQALVKDLKTARIYGLSYRIQSLPLYNLDGKYFAHDVDISGWEYTIQNDSQEYPVLSFKMLDRHDVSQTHVDHISNIKIFARPLETVPQISKRTVLAALFLMKQISSGFVPDPVRVLRVYRLLQDARINPQSDMHGMQNAQNFFAYKDQG